MVNRYKASRCHSFMKQNLNIIYLLIFLVLCLPPAAKSDWINLTGAENTPNIVEIHINDDHVKIELEIFVNDVVTFDRLIPEDFFKGTNKETIPCRAYATVFQRRLSNNS